METDTGIAPFSVVGKGWIANKSGKLVITEKSEKNQQQITMYVTQCTYVCTWTSSMYSAPEREG